MLLQREDISCQHHHPQKQQTEQQTMCIVAHWKPYWTLNWHCWLGKEQKQVLHGKFIVNIVLLFLIVFCFGYNGISGMSSIISHEVEKYNFGLSPFYWPHQIIKLNFTSQSIHIEPLFFSLLVIITWNPKHGCALRLDRDVIEFCYLLF